MITIFCASTNTAAVAGYRVRTGLELRDKPDNAVLLVVRHRRHRLGETTKRRPHESTDLNFIDLQKVLLNEGALIKNWSLSLTLL
jgi:hypothetical protein